MVKNLCALRMLRLYECVCVVVDFCELEQFLIYFLCSLFVRASCFVSMVTQLDIYKFLYMLLLLGMVTFLELEICQASCIYVNSRDVHNLCNKPNEDKQKQQNFAMHSSEIDLISELCGTTDKISQFFSTLSAGFNFISLFFVIAHHK